MSASSPYRRLDPNKVRETAEKLERRVGERFPGSGLSRVAGEVTAICVRAQKTMEFVASPHWPIRASAALMVAAVLVTAVLAVVNLRLEESATAGLAAFTDFVESASGSLVFLGALLVFLWSLETRQKRSRALSAIHELRCLAHVVDMHQLAKDPEKLVFRGPDTKSSSTSHLTAFELSRYLDYCSELLALLSKVAALYVAEFQDPALLAAVDQVEDVTNGLSRKIWQKMSLLSSIPEGQGGAGGGSLGAPPARP